MPVVINQPSVWHRVSPFFRGFDGPLLLAVLLLCVLGLLTMYSVGFDHGTRFSDHARNMLIAVAVVFVVAQVPPQRLMSVAVPLYVVGVVLLLALGFFLLLSLIFLQAAGFLLLLEFLHFLSLALFLSTLAHFLLLLTCSFKLCCDSLATGLLNLLTLRLTFGLRRGLRNFRLWLRNFRLWLR
jgi:hypothetical protein